MSRPARSAAAARVWPTVGCSPGQAGADARNPSAANRSTQFCQLEAWSHIPCTKRTVGVTGMAVFRGDMRLLRVETRRFGQVIRAPQLERFPISGDELGESYCT